MSLQGGEGHVNRCAAPCRAGVGAVAWEGEHSREAAERVSVVGRRIHLGVFLYLIGCNSPDRLGFAVMLDSREGMAVVDSRVDGGAQQQQ